VHTMHCQPLANNRMQVTHTEKTAS